MKGNRREFLAAWASLAAAQALSGTKPHAASAPFASAMQAADAIRRRKISSVELVNDLLARIDKYNPKLNAIVTIDRDGVLKQARAADAALSRRVSTGPLHGVPCCIKDTFEVEGMRTTAGANFLSNYVPEQDAAVVARLRAAGALIIGKTNVPVLAGDWQSYNDIFGTTNNPWNSSLTPGGSTGGGAAAIAAGLDYLTVGSDLGGSIRGPCHFCGVYGHKPSINLVSMRGHIPPPPGILQQEYETLAVAGPIARAPQDLQLALSILGGPDGDAARVYRWQLPPARKSRLRDYRIGYILDDPACEISSELVQPLGHAVEALRKAGVQLKEGWPDGISPIKQREVYEYILATHFAGTVRSDQLEATRRRAAQNDNSVGTIFARALTDPIGRYQKALAERMAARNAWQRYFRDSDAFLMPVTFVPAFPHNHSMPQTLRKLKTPEGERDYMDVSFWISFATLAGLPATAAPVGATGSGLPVGIQVLGPYLEDATPIDIVARMASIVGGFQVPPDFA